MTVTFTSTFSTPCSTSSPLETCALSIIRGGLVGAFVGISFHAIGGSIALQQGRKTLTPKVIALEAGRAGARLSAVVAGYTAVRCLLQNIQRNDALACAGAGACAVAVPTLADERRVKFMKEIFSNALSSASGGGGGGKGFSRSGPPPPVPLHLIAVSAAFSGAIILGGTDVLLWRVLGVRW